MPFALYLSHPEVQIDKATPVPQWSLSPRGRARARAASAQPWTKSIDRIVTSNETKAIETAQCFAQSHFLDYVIGEHMEENDRSSTGFLAPDLFEQAADQFMNRPDVSFRGWERAIDAQVRITSAIHAALRQYRGSGAILFIGHGGVGTLLKCQIAQRKIARSEDQPGNGGGNIFAFDLEANSLLCDWTPMEDFTGISS